MLASLLAWPLKFSLWFADGQINYSCLMCAKHKEMADTVLLWSNPSADGFSKKKSF